MSGSVPAEASENNRAVSCYLRGEIRQAEAILDAWLEREPTALYPWINRRAIALNRDDASLAEVAEEFTTRVLPAHPGACEQDPQVRDFAGRLRRQVLRCPGPRLPAGLALMSDGLELLGRLRQPERVSCVSFTQDGARAITLGHYFRQWDLTSGQPVAECLSGGLRIAERIALSPDGQILASAPGRHSGVDLHELEGGRQQEIAPGQTIQSLAFSADGRRLIVAQADGAIAVFAVEGGERLAMLPGARRSVISPDGRLALTGGAGGGWQLLDCERGAPLRTLPGFPELMHSLAISQDGQRVLVETWPDGVRLYEIESGALVRAFLRGVQVRSAALHPDGTRIVTTDWEGREAIVVREAAPRPWPLLVLPEVGADGRDPAEAVGRAGAWGLRTGRHSAICLWTREDAGEIRSVGFSPDGEQVIARLTDGTARAWGRGGDEVAVGAIPETEAAPPGRVRLGRYERMTQDGRFALVFERPLLLRLHDARDGRFLGLLVRHEGTLELRDTERFFALAHCRQVCVTPDGRLALAVMGRGEGGPLLIDLGTGQEVGSLAEHGGNIVAAAFSLDGQHLATADAERGLRLWRVEGEWASLEEVLPEAEALLSGQRAGRFWPYALPGEEIGLRLDDGVVQLDLEARLRVWGDVRRCADRPEVPEELRRRVAEMREGIREMVARMMRRVREVDEGLLEEGGRGMDADADAATATCTSASASASALPEEEGGGILGEFGELMEELGKEGDPLVGLLAGPEPASFPQAEWQRFVRAQAHAIRQQGREGLIQAALAQADRSPVTRAAEAWLRQGRLQRGWLRRIGRPAEPEPEVCTLTLFGHAEPVSAFCLHPDGQRLISAGEDRLIKIWDLTTGACRRTLTGPPSRASAIAASPDGQWLISAGGWENLVRVWDLASGTCLRTLSGHRDAIQALQVTPDGRRVISGGRDRTLRVWDLSSGECLMTLAGPGQDISCLALHPDGRRVLSGGQDSGICVWDLESGAALPALARSCSGIRSILIHPDGRLAALQAFRAEVWDLEADRCLWTSRFDAGLQALALHAGSRALIATDWDRALRVLDLDTGACRRTHRGPSRNVSALLCHPDGRRAIAADGEGTLRVLDLEAPPGPERPERHGRTVHIVAAALQGAAGRVLTASEDNTLRVWDLATGRCLHSLDGRHGRIQAALLHPDGRRALSAGNDGAIQVWDVERAVVLKTLKRHPGGVRALALHPDGQRALSGGQDGTLRLWDIARGLCLHTIEAHPDAVTTVALHPDGARALSAGEDGAIRLWTLEQEAPVRTLFGHDARVTALAVHPDGRRLLSVSDDETVRVWDLETGTCLHVLRGKSPVAALHPDGSRVLIGGGYDGVLMVFEVDTGRCLQRLEGHRGRCAALAFHPRLCRAVSAGVDRSVRVWDLERGTCLAVLPAQFPVTSCAFTAADRLVLGEDAGGVLFFDLCLPADAPTEPVAVPEAPPAPPAPLVAFGVRRIGPADEAPDPCVRELAGHEKTVTALAVHPDGRRLVSTSEDQTVRIWDLETGACQLTLQTSETHAAALLPDGERLLTRGRSLDLWDLRTGVCLRKLRASYGRVMALHPDGRQAFCDDYRRIEGWDLETGRRMRLLEGHEASINALLCHPDGQRLISAGDDRTLRIWDLASATCLRILGGHAEPVRTLLLHPDGRRLLCATLDERLRIWDLATGECLGTWLQPGDKAYHRVLALHPDGQTLLLGRGGRVEIADLAALRSRDALGGTGRDVRAVAAHLDGVHVVSGDDGGALRLWRLDAAAGRAPRHLDRVSAVCLEPRGGVALTSGDETLHLWDLEGRPLRALSGHSGRVRDVLLSGDRAVSGGAEGTVRVWDLGSGACRHVLTGHAGGIERLALHPDRQHLASCDELTVRVWELASGACHHVLTGHTQRIFALAFHPHGRLLISAGYDGTARVWDLASGACVRTLELPEAHALLVQPDGRRLIASGPERTVNLVDLETGAAVHRLAGHAAPVQRLTLVNDGQHLLSLAHDQAIRLWDLATGEWLRSFAHPANVLCMAQAGPWLVSSCTDDAVRVWKIETGACVGLWPLRAAATSLTLSPAGRIVAGDLAGEVAFLQIEGR